MISLICQTKPHAASQQHSANMRNPSSISRRRSFRNLTPRRAAVAIMMTGRNARKTPFKEVSDPAGAGRRNADFVGSLRYPRPPCLSTCKEALVARDKLHVSCRGRLKKCKSDTKIDDTFDKKLHLAKIGD